MRTINLFQALVILAIAASVATAIDPFPHTHEDVIGWKSLVQAEREEPGPGSYAESIAEGYPDIHNGTFRQPLDHGDPRSNVTFEQRYWYSLRHYKPHSNTPVPLIVLEGGETDAGVRLPFLDHGIVDILAAATGGIGIVLEHRYYGKSYPPRSEFPRDGTTWGVDELQWLTNWQAEQDSVQFVRNIQLDGVREEINSRHAPVITYGGSYAGARSAHLRILYPRDFWGGIASSGVTAALEDFPEYMDGVARGNDVHAVQALEAAIAGIDAIIAPEPWKGSRQTKVDARKQRALFEFAGVDGLSDAADFANLLMEPLGGYQSVNWDDAQSPQFWAPFMRAMKSNPKEEALASLRADSENLHLSLPDESLRLLHYVNTTWIQPCRAGGRRSADDCFGSSNYTKFINNPKLTAGKAWMYQVCTTWGYFVTAPHVPSEHPRQSSRHGKGRGAGPQLISSLLDHAYVSKLCQHGFPSTKTQRIPRHPRIHEVNRLGGFHARSRRLAFIDGQFDPWREATVHSETYNGGGRRPNTLSEPFWIIPNATHHWDEFGNRRGGGGGDGHDGTGPRGFGGGEEDLAAPPRHHRVVGNRPDGDDDDDDGGPSEPEEIRVVHELLVDAVKSWVSEWGAQKRAGGHDA